MKACAQLFAAARRLSRAGLLALAFAASGADAAATCDELIARIGRLSGAGSTEMVAQASTGRTFKQLYDECDRADTFAGHSLPTARSGRRFRCSTDPNRVDFVRQYPDRTVMFRAKMAVDADGSPVSMGPNAGQHDQPRTWLTFDRGSDRTYVNAEEVSFAVVPIDFSAAGISFQRTAGVKKGDLAAIFVNGKCTFGVVGDAGPYYRLGEGSLRAHQDLGNPQCLIADQHPCRRLRNNGNGAGIALGVTFILFPGTRPSPLHSQTVTAVSSAAARQKVEAFLDRYAD